MGLQLAKLQDNNKKAKMFRFIGFSKGWKDNKGMLQYWDLPYISEIIFSELVSQHHNDLLAKHFEIDKTQELVVRK